jgi:hypothetical protein
MGGGLFDFFDDGRRAIAILNKSLRTTVARTRTSITVTKHPSPKTRKNFSQFETHVMVMVVIGDG